MQHPLSARRANNVDSVVWYRRQALHTRSSGLLVSAADGSCSSIVVLGGDGEDRWRGTGKVADAKDQRQEDTSTRYLHMAGQRGWKRWAMNMSCPQRDTSARRAGHQHHQALKTWRRMIEAFGCPHGNTGSSADCKNSQHVMRGSLAVIPAR